MQRGTRCWFQILFMFIPSWGNDHRSNLTHILQKGDHKSHQLSNAKVGCLTPLSGATTGGISETHRSSEEIFKRNPHGSPSGHHFFGKVGIFCISKSYHFLDAISVLDDDEKSYHFFKYYRFIIILSRNQHDFCEKMIAKTTYTSSTSRRRNCVFPTPKNLGVVQKSKKSL